MKTISEIRAMSNTPPVSIFASDDPLLKNEKSALVIAKARKELPNAEIMIFTNSDFQSTGDANLKVLENELIDPGLFGGDRIIKIYLNDLNKTTAQVLLLLAQRIRTGIKVIVDLPRIQASYAKLPAKPYAPIKSTALKTLSESAISYIKGIGGSLEIIYPPQGDELIRWIIQRCSMMKLRCEPQAAVYIAECLEGNLVSIAQILELISVTSPGASLTPEFLEKYVIEDSRFSGFEVAQAILDGNSLRALNALNSFYQNTSSPVESLGQVISQLDNALAAITKFRLEHVERMDSRARFAFFLKINIKTLPMQKAIQKAALSMPVQLYDFLCSELAQAAKFLSSFNSAQALASLQTLCAAVGNFKAINLRPFAD